MAVIEARKYYGVNESANRYQVYSTTQSFDLSVSKQASQESCKDYFISIIEECVYKFLVYSW